MITLRRSDERGQTKLAWLDSQHTFSFAGVSHEEILEIRAIEPAEKSSCLTSPDSRGMI